MSHCGYFVTTLILVTSGLLSIGSSVKGKICSSVSNQHICYFQPKEDLTVKQWETAWNICQNNSATLPIIENQEVQKTFEEYLRNISLNTNETWLGGRQEVTKKEWLWSNKKPFYQPDLIRADDEYPRTQAVIWRISDSESPSNATLRYQASNPSWPCYCICQYSANQCPSDNLDNSNEHGCLKVFNNRTLNANEATKDCSNSGGYLALFDGNEFLTKAPKVYQQMHRYQSPNYTCYYIGLHRNDTKSWFWMRSNNEKSTMEGNYNNWSDRNNHTNGDCLFATANDHRWEASGCNDRKGFICQTTTTKTDTEHGTAARTPTVAAGNSLTTTATNAATTVPAAIVAGVVVVILCIIVILVVVVMRRKSKSSINKTEPAEIDSDTKDKKTNENPATTTTEERSIYAGIPLAEKTANDTVEGGQKGIVYASLDFNQGVTYAEPSTLYTNIQNVTGPIYAEP